MVAVGAALTAALLPLASRAEDAALPEALPGGSVSCGAANRGALHGGAALPEAGPGFVTPEPWRERGARFGTDEMVSLITRSAASVARRHPGGLLAVADLSRPAGGPAVHHRSHQSGRDVDLVYYAIDRAGDPFRPDQHMAAYRDDGRAISAESPEAAAHIEERFFDLARNWALVESLATDADVRVERVFVSEKVRGWLLAYAAASGVAEPVVARVRSLLGHPTDSTAHHDHMHVRIACSAEDAALGKCSDELAARRRSSKHRARVMCVEPPPAAAPR